MPTKASSDSFTILPQFIRISIFFWLSLTKSTFVQTDRQTCLRPTLRVRQTTSVRDGSSMREKKRGECELDKRKRDYNPSLTLFSTSLMKLLSDPKAIWTSSFVWSSEDLNKTPNSFLNLLKFVCFIFTLLFLFYYILIISFIWNNKIDWQIRSYNVN